MSGSISSLESKIDAVLALCRQLRGENLTLRSQRDALEEANLTLSQTIDTTRSRLESLMDRLPEEQ